MSTQKKNKKTTLFKNMLQMVTNLKLVLKIVEAKEVNNMNRTFVVKNSIKPRGQYSVYICNTPSCTCPKFDSVSTSTVYCKHIMFVLVFSLGVKDNSILQGIYISDEDLKTLLQKSEIEELYLASKKKKPSHNKRNLQEIFDDSTLMGNEQTFSLQQKRTRSASCTSSYCEAIFQIDGLCIKVVGQLLFHMIKTMLSDSHFIFVLREFAFQKKS